MASISKTVFNDTKRHFLSEGQRSSSPTTSSSSVEDASSDHLEALTDSNPVNIPESPSTTVTPFVREGARLTIEPVLDAPKRTLVNRKFFPGVLRSASYGGTLQSKITNLSTRAASVIHERESLVVNEEIQERSQYLGSDSPTYLEFPSSQNSDENQPEQRQRLVQAWERFKACVAYVLNSFYFVAFLLLLFGLNCFTFYLGIAFFHQCELLQTLPVMIVFLGASGTVGTFSRIIYVLTKKRWFARSEVCRIASILSFIYFNICYAIESIYFSSSKGYPTTEKGPGHCHPFFYNYVKFYNIAAFVILNILGFLHNVDSCACICKACACITNLVKALCCQ